MQRIGEASLVGSVGLSVAGTSKRAGAISSCPALVSTAAREPPLSTRISTAASSGTHPAGRRHHLADSAG